MTCAVHMTRKGVLPNTHDVYSYTAFGPTTRRRYNDTHFSARLTTTFAHQHDVSLPKDQALSSRQDTTQGAFSLTRDPHRTHIGSTSVAILCVRTLPDIMHHHDATQSQILSTYDHFSQELTTDVKTSTTNNRQATTTPGQHEMTNNLFTYSTRTEQVRRATLLSELDSYLLRSRLKRTPVRSN